METNKLICLVTEYASNGELYGILKSNYFHHFKWGLLFIFNKDYIIENKRLSERKAREIFRQILAAVNHCHLHGIVHRDLKVENLLFDSNRRVKLADFGFSCPFTPGELLDVFCGSPPYCAPVRFSWNHCNHYLLIVFSKRSCIWPNCTKVLKWTFGVWESSYTCSFAATFHLMLNLLMF